jgi:Fatty acid hydroxylase
MTLAVFFIWAAAGFAGGTVFSSFFEWAWHRYIMHRKFWKFTYPFDRHTLVHHHIFKADNTYHLHREEDKETVPMAWWNGPALIGMAQIPFVLAALNFGGIALVCGSLLATCLYYLAYEYLHWCMHIPQKRKVERNGLFFRLNGHHLLHHRYMNKNFNVVLPVFDLLFGTLLMRSKVTFAQARGPAVPDVQPRLNPRRSQLTIGTASSRAH